ncbi:MAG: phenylalanine--tRNA ligase subunit alpha [Candidatus Westeberhardia cardiocondylae]|nr:phenylalanine--tRNA ligase subunit alpha [Candidatus Westeberhardia cardiocondylae]
MYNYIKKIKNIRLSIEKSNSLNKLECIRIKCFGKNGFFSKEMKLIKNFSLKDKKIIGSILNRAKKNIQQDLINRKKFLENIIINSKLNNVFFDISLPGRYRDYGSLHPITCAILKIERFFEKYGFSLVSGSEIEDDYYNFDSLNIPLNHPARSYDDTFRFDDFRLLRTQTSSIQIRIMSKKIPPMRIFSFGKVYRKDHDKIHSPMFHQIEGFVIDVNIKFGHLKKMCYDFLLNFFNKEIKIRFRHSYFPFTEPSAEIDIMNDNGNWLEVLGCGMIHPNVLKNSGIDPDIYSGFAFGIGIERLIMLRYKIPDLRMFFENDLRFLKQFRL